MKLLVIVILAARAGRLGDAVADLKQNIAILKRTREKSWQVHDFLASEEQAVQAQIGFIDTLLAEPSVSDEQTTVDDMSELTESVVSFTEESLRVFLYDCVQRLDANCVGQAAHMDVDPLLVLFRQTLVNFLPEISQKKQTVLDGLRAARESELVSLESARNTCLRLLQNVHHARFRSEIQKVLQTVTAAISNAQTRHT